MRKSKPNGRWWPIEYDKVLTLPTADNQAHARWRNLRGKPDFRCIILPGMAELEQDGPPSMRQSWLPIQQGYGDQDRASTSLRL